MSGKVFTASRANTFWEVCAGSHSSPVSTSWPGWAPLCCSFSPICHFFPFFSTVSPLSMIGWLCHHSSRCVEAAGAGGDPKVECSWLDPFLHTLAIAGARHSDFWVQRRELDPISSPNCCFPIPGAKLVHPWDWRQLPSAGREDEGGSGLHGCFAVRSEPPLIIFFFFPAKAGSSGQNSTGNVEVGVKRV